MQNKSQLTNKDSMTLKSSTYEQELRRGLLSVAVLRALHIKRYAGEIITSLASTEFAVQEGTLYPLLSKLKREGLIDHEWVESQSGPPRKYYLVTDAGKTLTTQLLKEMQRYHKELTNIGGPQS
jgi:PadR family transcriptional regulator, regulatory protein PadR